MQLDFQKEQTPVLYGTSAVKVLRRDCTAPGELAFATHWHERMELLLIHAGSLQLDFGDRAIRAEAGSLVIIPPARTHRAVAGEAGARYDAIMFDLSAFYNAAGVSAKYLLPLSRRQIEFLPVTAHPDLLRLAESLAAEERSNDAFSSLAVVGKIYELIGLLYRHCLVETKNNADAGGCFAEIIAYMEAHFKEDLSSASLSRLFGYNEAYFCRRFKAVTGLSPMVYLRILRLESAKEAIKRGNGKLSEVALDCGFSDPSYFSQCFRRHFGISPSQYAQRRS